MITRNKYFGASSMGGIVQIRWRT